MDTITLLLNEILNFLLAFVTLIINFFINCLELLLHFLQTLGGTVR